MSSFINFVVLNLSYVKLYKKLQISQICELFSYYIIKLEQEILNLPKKKKI